VMKSYAVQTRFIGCTHTLPGCGTQLHRTLQRRKSQHSLSTCRYSCLLQPAHASPAQPPSSRHKAVTQPPMAVSCNCQWGGEVGSLDAVGFK
jgi:hypothetical protein